MEQLLKLFGLSEEEMAVYKALLEAGTAKVSDLAGLLKIKRTTCQEHLRRLLEKGFVNSTQVGNKYYYQPEDPDKFRQIINERQFIIGHLLLELKSEPTEADWKVSVLSVTEVNNKIKRARKTDKTVLQFGDQDIGGALLNDKSVVLISTNKELPAIEIVSKTLTRFHKLILGPKLKQ